MKELELLGFLKHTHLKVEKNVFKIQFFALKYASKTFLEHTV